MLPHPPVSAAVNRLWQPRLSLTACVRGVLSRDTTAVSLTDSQRFNFFPASPLCSISWWFSGRSEMLEFGAPPSLDSPRQRVLPRVVFGGPFTMPSISWNPGPAHGMMLMLMPDAMYQMTGIDPNHWRNRLVDIDDVLPPAWRATCQAVMAAPDDDRRVPLIESFLDPEWRAARPAALLGRHHYRDWIEGLALRAATSGAGRSVRQVERRIRQWAGQPLRELRGIGRAERAFFQAMAAADSDVPSRVNWAGVAAEGGYSDQSHLCRESRRVTGFSPEELRLRILHEEGFWAYRLWQWS